MERQKYISLIAKLRQIAMARAMALLNDHDTVEDVAEEVLLKLWERHGDLYDDEDKVKHLANLMSRNLSLNLLRHRRRHPIRKMMSHTTFPNHSPLNTMWKTKKRATSFVAP